MRYYDIQLTKKGGSSQTRFTSFLNGVPIPGALQVNLDIPVLPYATPMGGAHVSIFGVPLEMIGQASDFNSGSIKVYGGMQKGLPLANPRQAGLLMQGTIFQAYGNWIDLTQSLELICLPGSDTPDVSDKKVIQINWKKGTPLGDAVKNSLSTSYSGVEVDLKTSANLVLSNDQVGFYAGPSALTAFAQFVKSVSRSIINKTDYQGVDILLRQNKFSVYDGTQSSTSTKEISFLDLIGQPTWIEPQTIQFKCVMRADINVGDSVRLPRGILATTTPASQSQFRDKSVFQGTFQVSLVRHMGNFRQPTGDSWVTVFNAFPASSGS